MKRKVVDARQDDKGNITQVKIPRRPSRWPNVVSWPMLMR